jgi:hypothetical protein
MRRLFASLVASLLVLLFAVSTAFAAGPANPNCWGVVTAQRATALHDIGTHASSQTSPRLGLGNFARLLFDLGLTAGPHISDAGIVAAELDGIPETTCP